MTWTEKALIATLVIMLVTIAFLSNFLGDVRRERDSLQSRLSVLQVVNNITLSAVAINHRASLNNINAKQVEGTEHVKVKTVIKTVFKDSECAAAPVPADAVSELQKYATGIRARASGSASTATDR